MEEVVEVVGVEEWEVEKKFLNKRKVRRIVKYLMCDVIKRIYNEV